MNVIEFRLCPEDRARLDDIIRGLAALVPAGTMSDAAEALTHPADAPTAHLEPPTDLPAPAPAPDPVPAPAQKPISKGEFQKAIVTRCAESADTKKKVQALIHSYADSVSAIPEEKRAEVLAALAKI
jgi:hypothetical protein